MLTWFGCSPWFDRELGLLSVWSFTCSLVSVWFFFGFFDFVPPPKSIVVGDLPTDVNECVNGGLASHLECVSATHPEFLGLASDP